MSRRPSAPAGDLERAQWADGRTPPRPSSRPGAHRPRDLGFFYDRDDARRRWRLVGSKAGLAKFCQLLREYVADPRNAQVSEHEHHGPYMYLEVMTWTEPKLDAHAISGRLEDLSRLASILAARVAGASPGQSFRIGSEFAPNSEYDVEVEVAPDDFDPASADPSCIAPPSRDAGSTQG